MNQCKHAQMKTSQDSHLHQSLSLHFSNSELWAGLAAGRKYQMAGEQRRHAQGLKALSAQAGLGFGFLALVSDGCSKHVVIYVPLCLAILCCLIFLFSELGD